MNKYLVSYKMKLYELKNALVKKKIQIFLKKRNIKNKKN